MYVYLKYQVESQNLYILSISLAAVMHVHAQQSIEFTQKEASTSVGGYTLLMRKVSREW